jgi:hypothetical protein
MRRVLATERGGKLYVHRQTMIEPVFAHAKFNGGCDRFLRRGRSACRSEWRLIHATHNPSSSTSTARRRRGGRLRARGGKMHRPAPSPSSTTWQQRWYHASRGSCATASVETSSASTRARAPDVRRKQEPVASLVAYRRLTRRGCAA